MAAARKSKPAKAKKSLAGGAKAGAKARAPGRAQAKAPAKAPAKKRRTPRPTGQPNGRPPFVPTAAERKSVEKMTAVGNTVEEVALCIRDCIDIGTVRKHFGRELETARLIANREVGHRVYQNAIKGDIQAQKWWLACRAGWKPAESDKNPLEGLTIILDKSGGVSEAAAKK